jgi:nitrite reductase/ring-hydroxylating ferredoxin subunit
VKIDRRQMLTLAGSGCAGLSLGALCTLGPQDTEQAVTLSPLSLLPRGVLRAFPDHHVAAIRGDEGIAVISTRCTHLGCNLRIVGDQLVCPCHGGRFGIDGQVIAGPPPRALPWLVCGVDARGRVFFYPDREDRDRRPCPVGRPRR